MLCNVLSVGSGAGHRHDKNSSIRVWNCHSFVQKRYQWMMTKIVVLLVTLLSTSRGIEVQRFSFFLCGIAHGTMPRLPCHVFHGVRVVISAKQRRLSPVSSRQFAICKRSEGVVALSIENENSQYHSVKPVRRSQTMKRGDPKEVKSQYLIDRRTKKRQWANTTRTREPIRK